MDSAAASKRPDAVLVYLAGMIDESWEYLLLRRVPNLGGHWQGVTGWVEGSESHLHAAQREVLEETRFRPTFFKSINFPFVFPIPDRLRHRHRSASKEFTSHRFVAVVRGGEPILSSEHNAWKWCGVEQGVSVLKNPNDAEALRLSHTLLTQGST